MVGRAGEEAAAWGQAGDVVGRAGAAAGVEAACARMGTDSVSADTARYGHKSVRCPLYIAGF